MVTFSNYFYLFSTINPLLEWFKITDFNTFFINVQRILATIILKREGSIGYRYQIILILFSLVRLYNH